MYAPGHVVSVECEEVGDVVVVKSWKDVVRLVWPGNKATDRSQDVLVWTLNQKREGVVTCRPNSTTRDLKTSYFFISSHYGIKRNPGRRVASRHDIILTFARRQHLNKPPAYPKIRLGLSSCHHFQYCGSGQPTGLRCSNAVLQRGITC